MPLLVNVKYEICGLTALGMKLNPNGGRQDPSRLNVHALHLTFDALQQTGEDALRAEFAEFVDAGGEQAAHRRFPEDGLQHLFNEQTADLGGGGVRLGVHV